jgi:hypothetical protein
MPKQYESPQSTPANHTTMVKGGKAPSASAVVESANARSEKRHDTSGDQVADVRVLPDSGGSTLDKDGIHDEGYLVKKNLPIGVSAFYNSLPPGSNIEDQEISDIRKQPMRFYRSGLSYEGDGGF